jgi:hypothetical protein
MEAILPSGLKIATRVAAGVGGGELSFEGTDF